MRPLPDEPGRRAGASTRSRTSIYANGASLEQINWLADPSPSGRARSAGLMSNYLYEPDHIARRAERYAHDGEIAYSGAIKELLAE